MMQYRMRGTRSASVALLAILVASAGCAPNGSEKGESDMGWEIGELVPDVTLPGSDGKQHRLRDLAGERAFVIAWFPKAFTGG
jgi:hypothetical protein